MGEPSLRCERAENETRTRDPNLGKVVLYQLSYFRVLFFALRRSVVLSNRYWRFCECKGMNFSHTGKTFPRFFSKKVHFPRKNPIFARFLCKKQSFCPYKFFKAAHKN